MEIINREITLYEALHVLNLIFLGIITFSKGIWSWSPYRLDFKRCHILSANS